MSTPAKTRIGYIGLGDMGMPIAGKLLDAGFELTVCDSNPVAAQKMADRGARVLPTPADVASDAEIVFSCLPAPAISEEVAFGDKGIVHGRRIRVYIENSTIGQAAMQRIAAGMAARGIGLLDAPVSGGPTGAAAGRLSCFVSGSDEHYGFAQAALRGMCDRLFHIGKTPGQSQVLKLANNLINAASLTISSEMLAMATRAGIDPAVAIDVINASTGRNRATEQTIKEQILTGRYSVGARLDILAKDVDLAIAEAESLGASHMASDGVQAVWRAAMAQGRGKEDLTRIQQFIVSQGKEQAS
ncbi:MAG: NAD(P)-dependent oxidoreductase [Burkholderiaceae bacterium]|nr:NAD(P)-dependent oxidoreductase [Burkholderiaceae bacterium]